MYFTFHFDLFLSTCIDAKWGECFQGGDDPRSYPEPDPGVECDASKNFEYTTCEPEDPVTCQVLFNAL